MSIPFHSLHLNSQTRNDIFIHFHSLIFKLPNKRNEKYSYFIFFFFSFLSSQRSVILKNQFGTLIQSVSRCISAPKKRDINHIQTPHKNATLLQISETREKERGRVSNSITNYVIVSY
jgi:hypothetical protein